MLGGAGVAVVVLVAVVALATEVVAEGTSVWVLRLACARAAGG
jgi:hypothetical protein